MAAYNVAFVALTPPPGLLAVSAELKALGSPYVLGENSLAHVTLAQIEHDDPGELWRKLELLRGAVVQVTLHRAYQNRSESGKLWFGQYVLNEDKMREYHARVLKLLDLPDDAYINTLRDLYMPHCTTGMLPAGSASITTPLTVLERESMHCELHLGASGPNLQFERILY